MISFRIIIFISLLSFILGCYKKEGETTFPKAIKGVLDLRLLSLNNGEFPDQVIYLDGEWEFFQNEFLEPGVSVDGENPKSIFLKVPGVWNSVVKDGEGYGTYRLIIQFPENLRSPLVFKIPEHGTAYSMYANGIKLSSNGQVGKTQDMSIPQLLPLISPKMPPVKKLEIIFHVSNFHYREGGLWYSIGMGKENIVRELRERNLLLTLFLCGSILIMAIYHIVIFSLRRQDKSPLFFSLFCFIVLLRLLSFNEKYLNHLFPENSFTVLNKIEYLGYYLALPFFSHFLYTIFPNEFKKRILTSIWLITVCFTSFVIITVPSIYTYSANYFHLFTMTCLVYFIYVILKGIYHKREGAKTILVGTLLIIIGTTNDILYSMEFINTRYIIPECLLGFIFTQSIILSTRFSKAFNQVEELSSNLELKVRERTSELNNTLLLIRDDLSIAKRIQQNTLLVDLSLFKELKIVPLYLPKSEVGGDFYRINKVNESTYRFFLADATGHGIQAALITMVIKGIYDNINPTQMPIHRIMEIFNNEFIDRYISLNSLLTALIVDIDYKANKISYVSAGHPSIVVLKNSKVELLDKRSRMIGVIKDNIYNSFQLDFIPGDRLFLFTDGIFEEFNSRHEEFGEERLYSIMADNKNMPVEKSIQIVLEELDRFLEGKERQDDITIIGIEYRIGL